MAKLLIIDDQIEMARLIQKYMVGLNSSFTEKNTFCFSSKARATHIEALENLRGVHGRALMLGKKKEVFSEVFDFLNLHAEEKVLILIDVLLNSLNISAPSYERYRADAEYSCELYAQLLRIKNGKKVKNIRPDNFFHIIYSRSDASIGVVMAVLNELYEKQSETEKAFFPKECTLLQNISWCRNCCETTDEQFLVSPTTAEMNRPLALPEAYREFFKTL